MNGRSPNLCLPCCPCLLQVPLAGVYCDGVIGANLPTRYCSLRCTVDSPAAAEEGGASAEAAARAAAAQEERLGADRSDTLSRALALALLAGK